MPSGRLQLELTLGEHAADALWVSRVSGEEALSDLYRVHVDVEPLDGFPLSLEGLVGQEAALRMARPDGSERWVHGLVAGIELEGVRQGAPRYRVTLAPRLALLAHSSRRRIFQDRTVVEIVQELLDEAGIEYRLALSSASAPREYTVQHAETDLAFLSRLMAAEGLFYFFEHCADGHTLVLADATRALTAMPGDPALPYRREAHEEEEILAGLSVTRRVAPGKVALRDFDSDRPALEVSAQHRAGDALGLEVYAYPGGFKQPAAGASASRLRLEALRFGAESWNGQSSCVRLAAGTTFEVAEHPEPDFAQTLAVVRLAFEGTVDRSVDQPGAVTASYRNRFLAIRSSEPYRARPLPRRIPPAEETAVVVGAAGDEIHTDDQGRVKVQFHWDRDGQLDDHSSCWIRVAQAWAGPGFGTSVLPRVGQEVLVRYVDGDADRPLVVGALYNGAHPPPVVLPSDSTRTTLKSNSSPGGQGENELRFEDRDGSEEVLLQAQKDETVHVRAEAHRLVQGNEVHRVTGQRRQTVGQQQTVDVSGRDARTVGGSQQQTIGGARQVDVLGNRARDVKGNADVAIAGLVEQVVSGATVERVVGVADFKVGGAAMVNVVGKHTTSVVGDVSEQAGSAVERVAKRREETVSGNASLEVSGASEAQAERNAYRRYAGDGAETVGGALAQAAQDVALWSAQALQLEASDGLAIVVNGKIALELTQGGDVRISGATVAAEGQTMKLAGSAIKKIPAGGPAQAQEQLDLQALAREAAFIELVLVDQDGAPVANERVRVEFPDGTAIEAGTDDEGKVRVSGPKEGNCKVSLPRLHGKDWAVQ